MPAGERGPRKHIPVCRVSANGQTLDLFHLPLAKLRVLDAEMTGLVKGKVTLVVNRAWIGRFETLRITDTDDVAGAA